jgi:hypothetical protein
MSNTKNKERPGSIKITLGETDYEIPEFTILQTRDIWSIAAAGGTPLPDPRADVRRNFDNPIEVIATALSVAHPEIGTIEAVGKLKFSRQEMNSAFAKICAFSGLVITEGPKPGEAEPGT